MPLHKVWACATNFYDWKLVLRQTNAVVFASNEWEVNPNESNLDKHSILNTLENYRYERTGGIFIKQKNINGYMYYCIKDLKHFSLLIVLGAIKYSISLYQENPFKDFSILY